jgi:hypothetical protein
MLLKIESVVEFVPNITFAWGLAVVSSSTRRRGMFVVYPGEAVCLSLRLNCYSAGCDDGEGEFLVGGHRSRYSEALCGRYPPVTASALFNLFCTRTRHKQICIMKPGSNWMYFLWLIDLFRRGFIQVSVAFIGCSVDIFVAFVETRGRWAAVIFPHTFSKMNGQLLMCNRILGLGVIEIEPCPFCGWPRVGLSSHLRFIGFGLRWRAGWLESKDQKMIPCFFSCLRPPWLPLCR